ncbi:MAG: hypothetical protein CMF69_00205 [Magnetovibrio sp.]|nr:hypothetical protein [Magnetovibrio sp.]
MAYKRDCVPFGGTVTLRAIFADSCGNPVDVDDIADIVVAVYKPDDQDAVSDWKVEAPSAEDDFANATDTSVDKPPFSAITKIAKGFYEVTYDVSNTLDEDADKGLWIDIWRAEINGIEVYARFTFTVEAKGKVVLQTIGENTVIAIILSEDVSDLNGNSLESETQLSFSTTYNPYYCSVDLLRLECGSWLDTVPDDTLSLMIHWASIEADAWSKGMGGKGPIFETARTKFVVYDAALRALQLPADVGGKKKMLGDLLIETNGESEGALKELKEKREEWLRVVNAGGTIVPGQGLAPTTAKIGDAVKDYTPGRRWHKPSDVNFAQPSQNSRYKSGGGKPKFGWQKK